MKHSFVISLKFKVLLGCLLVALIPLLICSFAVLRVFETSLSRVTMEEGNAQIARADKQLGALFAAYEAAGEALVSSPLMEELLLVPDETQTSSLYLEFYEATEGLRTGARFMLFDAAGVRRYITDSAPAALSLPVDWGLLLQAAHSDGMVYGDLESYGDTPQTVLMRCARAIYGQEGTPVGYMVIDLSRDSFVPILAGLDSSRNDIYITDRFLSPVYSSLSAGMEERLGRLRREYMSTGRLVSAPGSNIFYHIATEPLSGFHILLEQPTQITHSAMKLMNTILIAAMLVCLFFCLLVSYLLSRSLTRPVQQLNDAMEQVKAGDLSVRVETRRQDELGQLTQSFNRMTEELDEYLRVSIQRQQELNDTQIRMLQAQLNPHFLYNTLDTMKWLGKTNGVPQVASLAQNLAVILRRSISAERFVTLEQELNMTQRYIDIQKIRFSGRFECVAQIPPELLDCIVPKLILQPIIENAIIHGLQNSDNGYLYLYARAEEDCLLLSVTDDGCGMEDSLVKQLNSGGYAMREGHLGLYNVNTIIKMHYGDIYGLHASAAQGVGTTVTAKIPIRKEATEC